MLLFLCSLILVRLIHVSVIYLKIVFDFHKKLGKYALGNSCTQRWFLGGNSRMPMKGVCLKPAVSLSRLYIYLQQETNVLSLINNLNALYVDKFIHNFIFSTMRCGNT